MAQHPFKTLGILLLALLCSGCSDVNDRNRLVVYLCDSPAAYSGVNVYIESVEVRRTVGSEGGEAGGTWVPMEMPGRYFALMELVNGKMQEAGSAALPAGSTYDAVRIRFAAENDRLVVAGENFPLAVAEEDAAVVVDFPAVTMDGPDRPLLFDIDVAASVVEDSGTESGYRFRPQVSFVDTDACGVVQGGLQAGSAAVRSRLWLRFVDEATGRIQSTYCSIDPAGAFFMRLTPGEYTLEVVPDERAGVRPYSTRIAVVRQQITDLGMIVLETNGY